MPEGSGDIKVDVSTGSVVVKDKVWEPEAVDDEELGISVTSCAIGITFHSSARRRISARNSVLQGCAVPIFLTNPRNAMQEICNVEIAAPLREPGGVAEANDQDITSLRRGLVMAVYPWLAPCTSPKAAVPIVAVYPWLAPCSRGLSSGAWRQ